jgi:hypothetical protein
MSDPQHNQTPGQCKLSDAPRLVNSAGPHARPELTDLEKTPGCGMLPEPGNPNACPTG